VLTLRSKVFNNNLIEQFYGDVQMKKATMIILSVLFCGGLLISCGGDEVADEPEVNQVSQASMGSCGLGSYCSAVRAPYNLVCICTAPLTCDRFGTHKCVQ
jgi:hypothetical protein